MYPASLILKGKVALQGSEAEQQLANLLLDENCQVLSSFELNQIASFTYGEKVCDQIFEILEEILSHPVDHSTLCIEKALAVTKHVLIYGAEKCVNSAWALGRHVNNLQEYNTVLIAQQRQGPDAWWQRVKGGGVDKGFPVREAATDLHNLLSSKDQIQLMRHTKSDPNSLVPIGDDKVAFATDEVRLFILKKRLEEQKLMHTQSNLVQERGGFGSGYNAKDGKSVVGAAHSLEEMMARAKRAEQKEKNKFSDEGPIRSHRQDDFLSSQMPVPVPATPEVDLLDLSTSAPSTAVHTDPFAIGDLLGNSNSSYAVDTTSDLLSLMTVAPSVPPVADLTQSQSPPVVHDAYQPAANVPSKSVMNTMSSRVDPFAALDVLTPNDAKPIPSAQEAQNRILGAISLSESKGPEKKPANDGSVLGMSAYSVDSSRAQPTIRGGPMASAWPPVPLAQTTPEYTEPDYSSMMMAATYGNPALDVNDDENVFVMGGKIGSGLEPTVAAPAAPPPPLPPSYT